jgi:hypothetical protein
MAKERNEAHLVARPAGHILSTDCWCEPSRMYWKVNPHGLSVFVVEHTDDTESHHKVILKERDSKQDWITTLLEAIVYHS